MFCEETLKLIVFGVCLFMFLVAVFYGIWEQERKFSKRNEDEKKKPPKKHIGVLQSMEQKIIWLGNSYCVNFKIKFTNGVVLNLERMGSNIYENPPFGKKVCVTHKRKELISLKPASSTMEREDEEYSLW